MIPALFLGWTMVMGTGAVVEHVQDNQILEASKAAAAAGQHNLAKELMCRAHAVQNSKECKELPR